MSAGCRSLGTPDRNSDAAVGPGAVARRLDCSQPRGGGPACAALPPIGSAAATKLSIAHATRVEVRPELLDEIFDASKDDVVPIRAGFSAGLRLSSECP